jgi:RNA polymerase sigma-70 factor (ECF subfamily)
MAMLIVLETLSPLERAVFVLREAFGMPYAEIGEIIGRKEEAARQLARRARDHVRDREARFEADQETRRHVTERFLEAAVGGDVQALMEVLAPGVTLVADGGGRVRAPRRPVHGADKVARFLAAVATRPDQDVRARIAQVNGGPGIVVTSEGEPVAVFVLDVAGGVVRSVHLVANPEKLAGVRAPGTP